MKCTISGKSYTNQKAQHWQVINLVYKKHYLISRLTLISHSNTTLFFFSIRISMWKKILNCQEILFSVRQYSRISPPQPAYADPVIRVSNNVAQLGGPKEGPKPRQLLSLPPFPAHPLPRKNSFSIPGQSTRVTAISWVKYYFDEISDTVIQSHFNKGLVSINF